MPSVVAYFQNDGVNFFKYSKSTDTADTENANLNYSPIWRMR